MRMAGIDKTQLMWVIRIPRSIFLPSPLLEKQRLQSISSHHSEYKAFKITQGQVCKRGQSAPFGHM